MNRSRIIRPFGACTAMLLALVLASAGCSDQNATPEQLIVSAKQERDKGQYRTAIIHLKRALNSNPQNAEARYLLGETLNDIGDFGSAEVELRRAIELRYDLAKVKLGKALLMMGQFQKVLDQLPPDPNVGNTVQAEILTLRARALLGLRRQNEGRELLEQALAKQPEFADALLVQGRLAANERKLDEASQLVERALARAPRNEEGWLLKGALARSKDDPAGAKSAYQKVLEISAENIPARLNIAQIEITSGNFGDARKQLEELRKIAPNLPMTKYLTALIEFRQKKYPAARDAVLQALKEAPDYLPSILLAGVIDYALEAHAQAQAELGQVLERVPGSLNTRKLLVASLAKSGQTQRAIEVLQPGIQQAPGDGELMVLAGQIYLQSNDFAKAAQYFEKAANLDPKSVGARTGLGVSRLASGETDRALADLESAVQLDPEKYHADMLLVMSNLRQANYDRALQAMQSLEKKQPNNPVTYHLKAKIYSGKMDVAAARKNLERALELNSTYIAAAIDLAQLDLQDKKPALARRRFEAMLEKDGNNAQALVVLANLAPHIGATSKEVIDWLERARKASPRSVRPQLLLARAYMQSGEPRKALEVAQQAHAAHPNDPEALDALGATQLGAGAKGQALATYNQLVALQPGSATALFQLAKAQIANADHTRAANTLRKAVSIQPDFVDAHAALIGLELKEGRYPAAMKIAQQLQKQSAKSPDGFVLEGDILMVEKKFPQAAKAYETAYGIRKNGIVLIKLHAAYVQAGKPEEAAGRLVQWLKESPDDAGVRLYIAEISLKNGKYRDAIEQYEWLLKKEPTNVGLLNNLAWAYHYAKDARALETAERAYKLKPDNAEVADTLGWLLVEQGNAKSGLELLQKAATDAPKVPEIRLHLAKALVKVGDLPKARQELERVLADTPGSPYAKEARELLAELRR